MGECPLWPPEKGGRKKKSSRLAFYEAKVPVPELLARACIHWLTSGPLQLNRNSLGLMAFSLTDLVRATLLFLENGRSTSVQRLAATFARPLLLGNIKLKVSDIPQNATRGFAIKGISIQKKENNKNPEIMTDGFHSRSLKCIPHKEPRSCRL